MKVFLHLGRCLLSAVAASRLSASFSNQLCTLWRSDIYSFSSAKVAQSEWTKIRKCFEEHVVVSPLQPLLLSCRLCIFITCFLRSENVGFMRDLFLFWAPMLKNLCVKRRVTREAAVSAFLFFQMSVKVRRRWTFYSFLAEFEVVSAGWKSEFLHLFNVMLEENAI